MKIYDAKIFAMKVARKVIGQEATRDLYLGRSVKTYQKHGIVFIHIPKAAGTSIGQSIYGRRNGHFTLEEIQSHRNYSSIKECKKFTVVRHPVERLISSYFYAKNGGGGEGSIRKDSAYQSKAFATFDVFVSEWLVDQPLSSLDRIFWPQSLFVKSSSGSSDELDFIGKLDEMAETERWLSSVTEKNITINHKNKAIRKSNATEISEKSMSIIKDRFRDDFNDFGYS